MYKIMTRLEEEEDVWNDVIDTKLSKTKSVTKIFFTEEEAEVYIKNVSKLKPTLVRIEEIGYDTVS